jgi:uncharacterized protein (TIGR00369 family)
MTTHDPGPAAHADALLFTSPAPFNNHARVEMLPAPAGRGSTRMAARPELTNHFGTVHGGALFTLGEVASARAVFGALGERLATLHAVTRSAQIRYLRAARGAVTASAEVTSAMDAVDGALERDGRAEVLVRVAIADAEGRVVAEQDVAWHVAHRPPATPPDATPPPR